MEYNFRQIEKKWQQKWKEDGAYKVDNPTEGQLAKPKFYVLDMFPYPSGAGLHVGHPLGYIASDIFSRYKRLKGFNVLHPMGFDSFGLPAEQYAIETGQHPADTTEKNIQRYHEQLDNIGFSFDWSREVRTSDPAYYKWTQFIFLQLFDSWFNRKSNKAERIGELVAIFENEGNINHPAPGNAGLSFTADEWVSFDFRKQQDALMQYRLAYLAYGEVNWCEALGTVLANDEVVNGVSERGGHPVVKKKLHQWYLRITEYADRLLQGLEQVDFSDAMKDMQRNWIGKSQGAEIVFKLVSLGDDRLTSGNLQSQDLTPNPSPKERGAEPGYINSTTEQWRTTLPLAKANRQTLTEAEDALWQELRNRKVAGCKFRRQHPIAGFIPDFVCLEKKLIVEIDGGYHIEQEQVEYDNARTRWLEEHNFSIIRFTNDQVLNDLPHVLTKLGEALSFGEGLGEVKQDEEKRPGDEGEAGVRVYTTRPDTIFGVDFMVLAPEHELVQQITTPGQKEQIEKYLEYVQSRSERERLAEVKSITGAFTGAYCENPFSGKQIPIWISEYVLAGYGTGAIMAVPCGDQRDFNFAKHFDIPITNIIGEAFNGEEANPTKDAILENSGFLNGMVMRDAIGVAIDEIEKMGIGKRQVNYRMRDAGFSRQRYWGEPFPIVYKDGIPLPLDVNELPVELPHVDSYGPGPEGEGPLANITDWVNVSPDTLPLGEGWGGAVRRETNTMPGYAGSSWYFLRYMDPHNDNQFVDRKVADYWGQVDLYIGGTEHAVGHLLYSRLWTKVLFDLGYIGFDEPFKKLVNQGMIQGTSELIYRYQGFGDDLPGIKTKSNSFPFSVVPKSGVPIRISFEKSYAYYFSADSIEQFNKNDFSLLHVPIAFVENGKLDISKLLESWGEDSDALFSNYGGYLKDGQWYNWDQEQIEPGIFKTVPQPEKMSKSKYNVVNPDDIVEKYGADTFRMYEMFLGPIDQSKPWDTKGIEGVHRFLRKFWRLYVDEVKGLIVADDEPTPAELKVLHKTIKKIEDDTERFSFNTAVSTFMIAVNELGDLKCHKKAILEPLLVLITPYAPHIAEELYQIMRSSALSFGKGQGEASILDATFPTFDEKYLVESSKEYPVSINGKVRTSLNLSLQATQPEVEQMVLHNEIVQKWLEGKAAKKVIFVKGKMINVVV